MAGTVRAALWAALITVSIIGVQLSVFAAVGPLPAPIPGFVRSILFVLSVVVVCTLLLWMTQVESAPPVTDMREEYELPNEYHWPIDER